MGNLTLVRLDEVRSGEEEDCPDGEHRTDNEHRDREILQANRCGASRAKNLPTAEVAMAGLPKMVETLPRMRES